MTYIPRGPKKPVELLLSADLMDDAETLFGDLSSIVEKSLCQLVDQEKKKRDPDHQRRIDALIEFANEFHAKHRVCGEEFSTL
jgi:hypothetical protein